MYRLPTYASGDTSNIKGKHTVDPANEISSTQIIEQGCNCANLFQLIQF